MSSKRTLEDIFKEIESEIQNALKDTGEEVVRNMRNTIEKQVYNSYTPLVYKRTGNLKNSPKIINLTETRLSVGIDDRTDNGFEGYDTMSDIIDMFTSGEIFMKGFEWQNGTLEPNYRPPIPLASSLMQDLDKVEKIFIMRLKSKIPLK